LDERRALMGRVERDPDDLAPRAGCFSAVAVAGLLLAAPAVAAFRRHPTRGRRWRRAR
jgi:hypothetical protein